MFRVMEWVEDLKVILMAKVNFEDEVIVCLHGILSSLEDLKGLMCDVRDSLIPDDEDEDLEDEDEDER